MFPMRCSLCVGVLGGAFVCPVVGSDASERPCSFVELRPAAAQAVSHEALPAGPFDLALVHGTFDPVEHVPAVVPPLAAGSDTHLHIVQLVERFRPDFEEAIGALGGSVRHFIPRRALLVEMSDAARKQVEALPFVRWVGPYHPAYRLEPGLRRRLASPDRELPPQRYGILVLGRPAVSLARVAARVRALGGHVGHHSAQGTRLEVILTGDQLRRIVRMDEVAFVDRAGLVEHDMDRVREVTGANFIEQAGGFTGTGVRGEILDLGVFAGHCDLQSNPVLFHTPNGSSTTGTTTVGIAFGDGTCDPRARGMLPDGQPIFADFFAVPDPYAHFAELVDPLGPYEAVFQSRSLGHPRTRQYTTISAEMDDLIFMFDVVVTQSMSNAGTNMARPEAWAKNVVSVGGVRHNNTLTLADDCWCGGASIGPAADGRIKPDLVHFYDGVFTLGGCVDCYGIVGGTSVSTPIVAGCFGLALEMWSAGIFGDPVDPGGTVFTNRPHMSTSRAIVINTARQYPFSGPGHDLTRTHQGWGLPDLRSLYEAREWMLVVDETEILAPQESVVFPVSVAAGEPALKATLVYSDPPGLPAATIHRINDLSLKVTAPSGTVYWGNTGLLAGNWSTPGGAPDEINTIENVFVQGPDPGGWTIEVIAHELNQDGHVETPELDADFALVVTGVVVGCPGDVNGDGEVNVVDLLAIIGSWGPCPAPCPPDLNGDGVVDVTDLLEVLGNWGSCP